MLAQRIKLVDRPIITNGLVGRWLAGAKSANDCVGSNHGTLSGTPTPTWTDLRTAPAVTVSGLNWLALPNVSTLKPATALSCAFWLNVTNLSADYFGIGGASFYGTQVGYLWDWFSGNVTFQIGSSGAWGAATVPYTGGVAHFVGTWDGATVKAYKDGVAGTQGAKNAIDYTGTVVEFGRYGGDSDHSLPGGYFNDLRIYNRALTANEALAIAKGMG
jgi:hypothetical protein